MDIRTDRTTGSRTEIDGQLVTITGDPSPRTSIDIDECKDWSDKSKALAITAPLVSTGGAFLGNEAER